MPKLNAETRYTSDHEWVTLDGGVVTVGILAFVAAWNSYMLPLFILSNEMSYTLPLGVQSFASQYAVDTARVLAFTSLSMIPALIFFSLFERRIVGGLTGAVKG